MTTGLPPDGAVEVVFEQAGAMRRVESVPLAQLSVEVGHLYMEDYGAGPDRLRELFDRVAPWVRAARERPPGASGRHPAGRVSTCFLVDDYFSQLRSPQEVVPLVLAAARDSGLDIDYLARESACANADGTAVAAILEGHLVVDPPPGTTGSRPPTTLTGWLSNGQRSPAVGDYEAMSAPHPWVPPRQNATERHSVFVDVELWDEQDGQRVWSCAFLAAVWQTIRLGLLRHDGRVITRPERWDGPWPQHWHELPPVIQLTDRPAPFSAYRTLSILDVRFLPIELAVRTILDQVAVDPVAAGQVLDRARNEGYDVPAETADRVRYVFL